MKKKVAVAHSCMNWGGSEARAMCILEALQGNFDLTLLTAKGMPLNWKKLNNYYQTDVDPTLVEVKQPWLPPLMRGKCNMSALRGAIFQRYCREVSGAYDLLISSYNPCDFGRPAMHFIADFSWDRQLSDMFDPKAATSIGAMRGLGLMRNLYVKTSRLINRPSGRNLWSGEDIHIANSKWTANLLKERYGIEKVEVIYPPVAYDRVQVPPIEKREAGFICLGRICYEKRIEQIVDILRRVRQRGYPVKLQVIGRIGDDLYGRMIKSLAAENSEWVILAGEKHGREKWELLRRFRFGIHGRANEAFGIAVAEQAKAGCIVFVPNSGGVKEIIIDPRLRYGSIDEATEKIVNVLANQQLQTNLQKKILAHSIQFTQAAFKRRLKNITKKYLSCAL